MDKPEEKKPASGPLRPPHPAPPGKKMGGLPKGPVPPRGNTPLSPMSTGAGAGPTPPKNLTPPLGQPARPPLGGPVPPTLPPKLPSPPSSSGPMPPPLTKNTSPAALPPAFSEAESVQSELQKKVADLEKRLMEEKEKVLLASLRSKEEEAVSAKVETSIKEIQEKLRREKREQELDEARRKAETRVAEMERRIAEEREAWVGTLKNQLGQRDQITQEMELHFSSRLKDLEYRWAQEKSTLETALRDREGELARIRQEYALKSEQEKVFWEDRLKNVFADRDKLERELERIKDKSQSERESTLSERQILRDQISRLESTIKLMEDQARMEKATISREVAAAAAIAKNEGALQRDALEKQVAILNVQIQGHLRDLQEKSGQVETLNQQLSLFKTQLQQANLRSEDREKAFQEQLHVSKNHISEIEKLTKELSTARATVQEAVQHAKAESEERVRVLQGRVDWYDANIRREYDQAREKVNSEMEDMKAQLHSAQKMADELRSSEGQRQSILEGAQQAIENLKSEKLALEKELEIQRSEWKQFQWDMDTRLHEVSEALKIEQQKLHQAEESKVAVELELRQRNEYIDDLQNQVEKGRGSNDQVRDRLNHLQEELELARNKIEQQEKQMESYKAMLHGQGLQSLEDVKAALQDKSNAVDRMKENISQLNLEIAEREKRVEIYREKEKSLREMMTEREETLSKLKNELSNSMNRLEELAAENNLFKENLKKERESTSLKRKEEFEELQRQRKEEIEHIHRQRNNELEQAKRLAAEEAVEKFRAELPPTPNAQALSSQIRQQIESEMMERLRQVETDAETRISQAREESKKELDKVRWENESQKEELKKLRQARTQLEREAQQILQQAEDHFRRELAKARTDSEKNLKQKSSGFFTTLGRVLDTPIIDTTKKKMERENE